MHGLFKAITISHKKASLQLRGQIALNEEESKALMLKIRESFDVSEVLVLSTCNRTEVYYVSENNLGESIIRLIASQKVLNSTEVLPYFDVIDEHNEAVRYLFEVSMGLHSQVVGDLQIPNQVKHAYQWAADVQMAGPFLHRLLHTIFFTNKKVVQETSFRDGAASTSYATVEVMETFLPLLSNPKVLVVGLGEIGEDVCRTLADKGYKNITITNRTLEKAQKLANELGFEVADYQFVNQNILDADIIISSVRCESPIITKETLKNKTLAVKYLIDLSVPNSIATDIEEVAGVVAYNLDEIQRRANEALQRRMEAIPQVLDIISDAIGEFNNWSQEMIVSPTIQKLKGALEQIRKEEMARFVKELSVEEAEKMEKITASMMQKIIKLPVIQLKAACKRGEAETLIDVLNDLFNLEKQTV
ncbi:glutamyl-tRNA reductase [Emticicia aquatilis]|uniref:Glutamyl-tRNA reductase n=1 Tax=Emticicia aquatilis TaxID=1537369 RepID=A0A916YWH6_9BACT|nr:glutamyl-tRNA reductase [Emticicia aquatilis]GGD63913.1 glutamyl-tRNA reductase [Emticicia aquatilis]